jgi:S-sulfo-L-cysteine synthase (O-acetyl-L-serine-dependent)
MLRKYVINMATVIETKNIQPVINSPVSGLEAVVGNTPLLPLRRITAHLSPGVQVWAKAEWFNPGGSVKDRPALNIISNAIRQGKLEGGRRLLDSTSGNMGISYATLGAALNIPITLTIPANASQERITILRALGAELILTDPLEGSDGAMRIARQISEEQPERFFYANQYDNPANWESHFYTTGPEIYQQTQGQITHFVAGLGTTGTMMGVGRFLKRYKPDARIIAVQPDGPIHGLEGLKHMQTSILPKIYEPTFQDKILETPTETAYSMVQKLAREEGMFVGVSSGASAAAALSLAEELEEGLIVAIFPDAGYKYMSDTALWKDKR